jgi:putative ABC transport system permease protein
LVARRKTGGDRGKLAHRLDRELTNGVGAAARNVLRAVSMWSLARKILFHDRVKFGVASAGVSISVLLIMVQLGLYLGFMGNASNLIDHSHADIWVVSKGSENFDFAAPMDDRTFYRVAGTPGVERAEQFILAFGMFKLPEGGDQGVQVVGVERGSRLFSLWNVFSGDPRRMAENDGIVVDRSEFKKLKIDALGARREITGTKSHVIALTNGIRSFTSSPFVFTNIDTARSYSRLGAHDITYVLVAAAPGVDVEDLTRRLNRIPNVDAYTKKGLSERTREYWSSRTGVGVAFFSTAILGIIIGLVVVGQILYNGTLEHLKEYGTLKAMGAKNATVIRVILNQAFISAGVGFLAGGALSVLTRTYMKSVDMTVLLPPSLIVGTALLTVLMCALASLLSILKVLRLDPATVFKG